MGQSASVGAYKTVSEGFSALDEELVTGEPSKRTIAECPHCGHRWKV